MFKMMYVARHYDDIDKTYLTALTRKNQDNKKDNYSPTAQRHLLAMMHVLASNELIQTYFCEVDKNSKCRCTAM